MFKKKKVDGRVYNLDLISFAEHYNDAIMI